MQRSTFFVLTCGLLASGIAAQDSRFSESTSVVAVEVPVQVVVEGAPVKDLTRENFEVYDGRTKQELTGFEVIDLKMAPTAVAVEAPPIAARRHFLFLFDLTFSDPESLVKARQAARDMVATRLHPSDLVAVATYGQSRGPQLVLGFTGDRRQAQLALDTLGVPQLLDRAPDPLRLALSDYESSTPPPATISGNAADAKSGRDAAILENFQQMAMSSDRANRANMVGRVSALTRSFADLARMMSGVRGRKYVVYLSEGFDNTLLSGTEGGDDQATRSAIESGETWKVDSEARFGSTRTQNDMEKMLEEFRRADCVIQAVNIGGLRVGGDQRSRASGEAGLLLMAKDTGGELFQNFNNLGEAMSQMLDRTSVTYVLTFQPDVKADGSYRRIDVRLKNAPRGARLVHRPGYYAPKPYAERAGMEKQLAAAEAIVGGHEAGGLDMSVLVAPFRPLSGKAYVPVLIEVSGASLLAGVSGELAATEVYVYAFDADGHVRDFVVQSVGLDLKKAPPQLKQTGFKFFAHLDLDAGAYSVRAFVRNGSTGASALRVASIVVPGAGGEASLLPPLVPEQEGKWWVARETLAANEPPPAYPFMLGKTAYVPAARPAFAGPTLLVIAGANIDKIAVYALEMQDFSGKTVATVAVTGLQRVQGDVDRLAGRIDAKAVAPGLYQAALVANLGGKSIRSSPLTIEVVRQ